MSIGPVELRVLTYDEQRMGGLSGASLQRLVDGGVIRVVDAVLVHEAAPDDVRLLDLFELDGPESAVFEPLVAEVSALIDRGDVRKRTAAEDFVLTRNAEEIASAHAGHPLR